MEEGKFDLKQPLLNEEHSDSSYGIEMKDARTMAPGPAQYS